jgi:hypothetical protein
MAAVLSIAMIEGGVMPKEEWGVKRVCPTTGKRFYDLGRIRSSAPTRARWSRSTPARAVAPWWPKSRRNRAKAKKETEEDLVLEDDIDIDDDDDADVDIDDDDVLDDDDDSDTVALDDLADVAADDDDS